MTEDNFAILRGLLSKELTFRTLEKISKAINSFPEEEKGIAKDYSKSHLDQFPYQIIQIPNDTISYDNFTLLNVVKLEKDEKANYLLNLKHHPNLVDRFFRRDLSGWYRRQSSETWFKDNDNSPFELDSYSEYHPLSTKFHNIETALNLMYEDIRDIEAGVLK